MQTNQNWPVYREITPGLYKWRVTRPERDDWQTLRDLARFGGVNKKTTK